MWLSRIALPYRVPHQFIHYWRTILEILHQSENLLVRYCYFKQSGPIMVLFPSLDERTQSTNKKGFGEDLFSSMQRNHILITCRDNSWFQYSDMAEACASIKAITKNHKKVVAYGSSMGGYGAMAFTGWIGANIAISIAPQYSVDPTKVPFEDRWHSFRRGISAFVCDDFPSQANTECKNYIFYDPFYKRDAEHAKLLQDAAAATECYLSFGGHLCAKLASDLKLLRPAIEDVISGCFTPQAFHQRLRSERKKLPRTWAILADVALSRNKIKLAERAARQGLLLDKEDHGCLAALKATYTLNGGVYAHDALEHDAGERGIMWPPQATVRADMKCCGGNEIG
jgi:hypothetical protein